MWCSSSARYRRRLLANAFGVVTALIDRFIAEDGKGPYRDMECVGLGCLKEQPMCYDSDSKARTRVFRRDAVPKDVL